MKTIRNVLAGIVVFYMLFVAALAFGQSATPPVTPPDPLETGWNVSVNGGFSSVSNAGTNNGFFFSSELRVAQHWAARADVFVLNDPAVTVTLVKPEYRLSANHIFKNTSGNYAAVNALELFVNFGAGSARFTDPAKGTQSKFAYGGGGGFDYKLSDKITVRPLDVSWLKSSLTGQRVIGNHLQFEAGLGLRF